MNDDIINKIIELAQEFKVTKLIQYGSSIDSFELSNDVDFACDGINDKNFFKFGRSLETLLNKPIDLIPIKPNSEFIDYILRNGKIIYESTFN
ncbi:MAG: hypothetical protein RO257_00450 [Candidatus Kapabacteria bacterium]|jgi:predicted nucleotidyltransferase|nr:hypothetical protein [Candidatus Kapabacteria bacterium]